MVLLDEPAAGLPDEETEQLGNVIRSIPEHMGSLVILVDHDMSLVSACCQVTAVLDFGKLIASGPTDEVLRDENVMRAYLGTEDGRVTGAVETGEALRLDGLTVERGGRAVVRGVSFEIPPGRGHRAAGAERRRQVEPGARRGRRAARSRARSSSASASWPGAGPRRSARPAWPWSPRGGGCFRT